MADLKVKQENEAKGKKGSGSFGKLNAATRRAIYSFGILAGLFLLFSVLQVDKFLAPANLQNLLQQIVTYTIIGCGLTFCLVCGGNDLSAGASMALSGIIMVSLLTQGLPLGVCIVLCRGATKKLLIPGFDECLPVASPPPPIPGQTDARHPTGHPVVPDYERYSSILSPVH